MLNSITWTQYLIGLITLALVYYTWIVLRFYLQDLRLLLSSKKSLPSQRSRPTVEEQQLPDQPVTAMQHGEETFDRIESLISQLKSQIHEKDSGALETNLSDKLRSVIQAYPDLKSSPFCPSINEMIIKECHSAEIPPPDQAELQQLWQ